MELAVFIPITGIIASAWVTVMVLRYRMVGRQDTAADPAATQENMRLRHENEALTSNVASLEDRLSVLERIITDPAERTAREIERLR